MYDFSNQVVLITGASGNLGSAVVEKMYNTGAKLALFDRSIERTEMLFTEMLEARNRFFITSADVTNEDSTRVAGKKVVDHYGQIDILVNTVGGYRAGTPLYETPVETFDFMYNLNARSVFITCQAVIPYMLEKKQGKIISVAARSAIKGVAKAASYDASKSAVIRLTESMAAELKLSGINVNCILPGTIDTPQNRKALPNADNNQWVTPEALADVILFLASDVSRAIHGAAIPVYGLS